MNKHDYLVQLMDMVEANVDRAVKQKMEVLAILSKLNKMEVIKNGSAID